MFDIGFTELLVISIVALIVIGPERLPRVARTLGHLMGRMQRYVADVKADINREMELEELRKMRDSVQEAAGGIETSLREEFAKTESELKQTAEGLAGTEVSRAREDAPAIGEKPAADPEISRAHETAPAIEEKQQAAVSTGTGKQP